MIFDNEFKVELSILSHKEKDKLILRLLKKDLKLAKRMYFEMVETSSVDELRAAVEASIVFKIENISNTAFRKTPSVLSLLLRKCTTEINEHVYTTKDTFDDPWLNLFLLNNFLKNFSENVVAGQTIKHHRLGIYIVAKIFKILTLISKLDSDYLMEFKDELKTLGTLVANNHYLMKTAINNMLDVNWLLSCEIPDEIEFIVKEVKKGGGLR
jgi:hypothetical protein